MIRKLICIFMAIALVILAPACSEVQVQKASDAADTALTVSDLKAKYHIVETMVRAKASAFSEEEMRTLNSLDTTVDLIITKLDTLKDPKNIDIGDVEVLYYLAREGYIAARSIIEKHIAAFSESDKVLLRTFDARVVETSKEIDKLLEDPTLENLRTAARMIPAILNVAFKVIPLIL